MSMFIMMSIFYNIAPIFCREQIRIREQMAEDLAEKRMQILIEAERAKNKKRDAMTDDDDEWVSSVVLHQEKVKVQVCTFIRH